MVKLGKKNKSLWPWPSCQNQPRTLSFRATNTNHQSTNMFKTMNSIYSLDTNSSESPSFSTEDSSTSTSNIETMINLGLLKSERLFFEPGGESSSLLPKTTPSSSFRGSVVLSLESQNPYVDFRKSIEEMVEAHGLRNWDGLEELLCWLLKANDKTSHGFIIGAFVDFLVSIANFSNNNNIENINNNNSESNCSCSYNNELTCSSPLSLYTSSSSLTSSSSSLTSSSKGNIVAQSRD
ncbi:hypothetical protein ACFE04_013868 [Oxalis oulophora]